MVHSCINTPCLSNTNRLLQQHTKPLCERVTSIEQHSTATIVIKQRTAINLNRSQKQGQYVLAIFNETVNKSKYLPNCVCVSWHCLICYISHVTKTFETCK